MSSPGGGCRKANGKELYSALALFGRFFSALFVTFSEICLCILTDKKKKKSVKYFVQYHGYIRQNGRKPAAQSYRACKMAASCTFRTDYAFLWAQAVLFCWVRLETWVLRTSQKKESVCMRTKKMRLVSALLALAMLFVMMPVGAFADDETTTAATTITPADVAKTENGVY